MRVFADSLRPYAAAFAARFSLMLQYRAAALAGFGTQCWWGGIKVMVYAAFYAAAPAAAAAAPMSLSQVITYTWITQGLLALVPWGADPDVAQAVRTGGVGYDRLRPVDAYALWFARACAWMTARAAPRCALMFAFAAVLLPLVGLSDWAWGAPASLAAGGLFTVSVALAVLVSASIIMLVNLVVVATLTDRGANVLLNAVVIVFSGNLLPLALYPDWMQTALLIQPLAAMMDIPLRIYTGQLEGAGVLAGLGLQVFWILVLATLGRAGLERAMRRLEVQGG